MDINFNQSLDGEEKVTYKSKITQQIETFEM
jgi:hypothetical protein